MQTLYCRKIASNQYQVLRPFKIQTPIVSEIPVITKFYILHTHGLLELLPGYVWNGGDWPAIDTDNMIYASAIHDVFCQMLYNSEITWYWRKTVNTFFVEVLESVGKIIIKKGPKYLVNTRIFVLHQRCKWVYKGVDKLGPNPRKKYVSKQMMAIPG